MPCFVLRSMILHAYIFRSTCLGFYAMFPLDPMVFVTICTPWPKSKGLDHPFLHVYACLLLCFMLALASLFLGFATLDALSKYMVMWLHLTPMRPCLDATT